MRRAIMAVSFLFLAIYLMGFSGCASKQNIQTNAGESEYRRMMDMQKQKATIAAEEKITKKITDMTSEDLEQLGDGYMRKGNATMAFVQYQKAVGLDPKRTTVRYKLGILYLRRGLPADATKEFEEMLKIDPNSALACEGRGRVYLANSEWEKAKENFSRAAGFDPTLWQAHAFIGTI